MRQRGSGRTAALPGDSLTETGRVWGDGVRGGAAAQERARGLRELTESSRGPIVNAG
jgi:hypothetical protein